MRYLLLSALVTLLACSKTPDPTPTPKIAEPQREALEQAKNVEQVLKQEGIDTQKKMDTEVGK